MQTQTTQTARSTALSAIKARRELIREILAIKLSSERGDAVQLDDGRFFRADRQAELEHYQTPRAQEELEALSIEELDALHTALLAGERQYVGYTYSDGETISAQAGLICGATEEERAAQRGAVLEYLYETSEMTARELGDLSDLLGATLNR